MEVTIDRYRVLHLVLLMFSSFIIAKILILKWEWSLLSAYGFGVTISTQVSNSISKIIEDESNSTEDKKREEKRERVEKRRERRNQQNKVLISSKKK